MTKSKTASLAIVIPTLNEAETIEATLRSLAPYRRRGYRIILADGGSTDNTVSLARSLVDEIVVGPRGRGRQLNRGAAIAHAEVLLFLHADTTLPKGGDRYILKGLTEHRYAWGRFNVRLSGHTALLRMIETLMNWRSRITGIATGDQAIFVRRDAFHRINGFPDIDIMEDIVLSRRLKRMCGRPLCLHQRVVTSSRRWEKDGTLQVVFKMWLLRVAFAFGAPSSLLAKYYK